VRAVLTEHGRIACERVLLCAGIWGPKVGELAAVPVPLTPVEHQFAWTTPLPAFAGETREIAQPVLRHQDRDLYFRQRRDHYAVGSYAPEPVLVEATAIRNHAAADDMPASHPFTPETFAASWREAVDLLPALGAVEPAEAFNGIFSFTADGFPLLGESAALGGFWLAESLWITHAGGAAKAVAEWMVTGRPGIDVHECDVNRFDAHAATPAYVRTRAAQQFREVYDVVHPLQPALAPRLLRTSLFYERQRELGAWFGEGRGWEQPRWFAANEPLLVDHQVGAREGWAGEWWSPIAGAEHRACRERVALFDMTPLTKIEVSGAGAAAFLERVASNRVDRPVGSVSYALLLDEGGGIRSDVTVARLGEELFQLGANGLPDLVWLRRQRRGDEAISVAMRDLTGERCCLGLWGPRARAVIERVSDDDWGNEQFPYYTVRSRAIGEVPVVALRVSYVGELGWELYASPEYGRRLWDLIWEAGREEGLIAAGRAAFDTLRLEKGYPLWGTDMTEEDDPWEAGVGFAVRLRKGEFVGRAAALAGQERGPRRVLGCLTLDDPAVVVLGKEPVWGEHGVVGFVTSAGFGFTVGKSIAYGWLEPEFAAVGTRLEIEFFGERHRATVTAEPLWDPAGERLRC